MRMLEARMSSFRVVHLYSLATLPVQSAHNHAKNIDANRFGLATTTVAAADVPNLPA